MSARPRIAVLTSRDLVRHGIQGMLRRLPMPIQFVGSLDATYPADLIIIDATSTLAADAEHLQVVTNHEHAPVVLLTSDRPGDGFGLWEHPVHAYVTVSATDAELVAAVAAALRASAIHHASRALAAPHTAYGLSPRQTEVLAVIATGKSNSEGAEQLFIGVNTMKTHLRSAYRKIGVSTRPSAILWALDHGLGTHGVSSVSEPHDVRWSETKARNAP